MAFHVQTASTAVNLAKSVETAHAAVNLTKSAALVAVPRAQARAQAPEAMPAASTWVHRLLMFVLGAACLLQESCSYTCSQGARVCLPAAAAAVAASYLVAAAAAAAVIVEEMASCVMQLRPAMLARVPKGHAVLTHGSLTGKPREYPVLMHGPMIGKPTPYLTAIRKSCAHQIVAA